MEFVLETQRAEFKRHLDYKHSDDERLLSHKWLLGFYKDGVISSLDCLTVYHKLSVSIIDRGWVNGLQSYMAMRRIRFITELTVDEIYDEKDGAQWIWFGDDIERDTAAGYADGDRILFIGERLISKIEADERARFMTVDKEYGDSQLE